MKKVLLAALALLAIAAVGVGTLLLPGPAERAAPTDAQGYRVVSVPARHREGTCSSRLWYLTGAMCCNQVEMSLGLQIKRGTKTWDVGKA
ncbi:MAG: hypothetical protein AAF718_06215 [Pseudomonadota bacterium]